MKTTSSTRWLLLVVLHPTMGTDFEPIKLFGSAAEVRNRQPRAEVCPEDGRKIKLSII